MGASRKLQGEIDRVLKKVQEGVDLFDSIWNKVYDTENANQKEKFEADLKKEIKKLQRYRDQIKTWIQSSEIKDKKVSASYEQALVDSRKLIEREMERFKICEKETKTKAFSKEGLGQQPKTDPKEKAKSETRDWLNNTVSELESQIDSFEAEIEGLSVKKGKTRPPRLTHLETSITRHKAHIMKLELILRLLDNDELSPEEVNDVKDFLDDYVDRNQEDFDDFEDVDELYNTLPLDKVESLEDLVSVPPLVKVAPVLSLKTSLATSSTSQVPANTLSNHQQGTSNLEHFDDTTSPDSNSDNIARTPPAKSILVGSPASTPTGSHVTSILVDFQSHDLHGASTALSGLANLPSSTSIHSSMENASAAVTLSPVSLTNTVKAEELSISGALGTNPLALDMAKKNILGGDERLGNSAMSQPLVSPLSNRMIVQATKANEGTAGFDSSNIGEAAALGSSPFSPTVSGTQWRPPSSFQNQPEPGKRPEFAPDQREKFLQKFQQVQQHGSSNILGMSSLAAGNHKQFQTQQQNPILQQFNSPGTTLSSPSSLGLGVQALGFNAVPSATLQQATSLHQQTLMASGLKDTDSGHLKMEEQQLQQTVPDDSNAESASSSVLGKNIRNEDESPYTAETPTGLSSSLAEPPRLARETDFSPGQPLQSNQQSTGLGVIGRRSVADLGAIGDNSLGGGSYVNSGGVADNMYNLQMLEAASYRIPQPRDSERQRPYIPRHPVVTPASYPQTQAPLVNNPAFWERLSLDGYGTDSLFFTFYFQQNTYQQYLAARELKKQSWRYHRKYNTWFQRHEEPKTANDEYEQGTYVYFDFHIANDDSQHGWCQRIKTEFSFEYSYLEDELVV